MGTKTLLAGAAVLAVGAGALWLRRDGADAGAAAPTFRTAPVERGTVVETVSTTGTLQALTTVEVGTQVSGRIAELLVDFNDRVTQGQVLARLETDVLEARLAQDEASLISAEAAVERAKVAVEEAIAKERRLASLYEQKLAKVEELEAAGFAVRSAKAALRAEETRVVQGQAAVRMARTNLNHATITSPIDGVVVSRAVNVGQTVAASLQAPILFTLAGDLRQMRVEAAVDEADIGRIGSGQPVSFSVDAYPERRFRGTVVQRRLGPTVTQNVVTYQVIIHTENPDELLLPGMTANVAVEVARADEAWLVPSAALRFRPRGLSSEAPREGSRGPKVWTLREGQPTPIEVRVGPSDGEHTAVEGELAEGLSVLTGMEGGPDGATGPVNPMALLRGGQRPGGGSSSSGGGRSPGSQGGGGGGGRRP